MNWLQLFISLSLLIVLHEGGHFLAARMFKTRVEKFYLFFDFLFPFPNLLNFSIFKFKKGDTEYGLGWFPLGGYVSIAGMADETKSTDELASEPQPWEFRAKPAWQRLIIILGGIIVNILVGIIIFWGVKFAFGDRFIPANQVTLNVVDSSLINAGMQTGDKLVDFKYFEDFNKTLLYRDSETIRVERNGEIIEIPVPHDIQRTMIERKSQLVVPRFPFLVNGFVETSPNKDVPLEAGDQLVKIDTVEINYFDEIGPLLKNYKNQSVNAVFLRNGSPVEFNLKVNDEGYLGIFPLTDLKEIKRRNVLPVDEVHYGFFQALPVGVKASYETIANYARSLTLIFKPSTGAYKEVGGFIGMSKMFKNEFSWEGFWLMTGVISLILAFMNFLPIPMLDGGYVVFILYEMIVGRPPSEKFMNFANNVGFFILIGLMLYANGNDILKLFTGGK